MPPVSAGWDGGVYPGLHTSALDDETVTDDVPDFPSTSAVIVAAPALTAVTNPPVDTVATDAADVDQLGVRSSSMVPFASLATAVSVVVPPTAIATEAGVTDTDATGTGGAAFTVILAVPLFASHVAVMTALPTATAVTSPLVETLATAGFELVQPTVFPEIVFPEAERGVAVSGAV
jgi:hypothetical protein